MVLRRRAGGRRFPANFVDDGAGAADQLFPVELGRGDEQSLRASVLVGHPDMERGRGVLEAGGSHLHGIQAPVWRRVVGRLVRSRFHDPVTPLPYSRSEALSIG